MLSPILTFFLVVFVAFRVVKDLFELWALGMPVTGVRGFDVDMKSVGDDLSTCFVILRLCILTLPFFGAAEAVEIAAIMSDRLRSKLERDMRNVDCTKMNMFMCPPSQSFSYFIYFILHSFCGACKARSLYFDFLDGSSIGR